MSMTGFVTALRPGKYDLGSIFHLLVMFVPFQKWFE